MAMANDDIISPSMRTLELPDSVKSGFEEYVKALTSNGKNPYIEHADMNLAVAAKLADLLVASKDEPGSRELLEIITAKANGTPCPALVVKNGPSDPEEAFLPKTGSPVPSQTDDPPRHSYYSNTFNYAASPVDRGKDTFVVEWFEIALSSLMGYTPYVHPLEQAYEGKGNAFHSISPRQTDGDAPFGVGAGALPWHTENPHENSFSDRREVEEYYHKLHVDLQRAADVLETKDMDTLLEPSYAGTGAIGALILTYSAAGTNNIPTSVLMSQDIKDAIIKKCGVEAFNKVLNMNIAFKDVDIEKGEIIGRMLEADEAGNVTKVKISLQPDEMVYVGSEGESPEEFRENQQLFKTVCECIANSKGSSVTLQRGDYLLLNNSAGAHRRDRVDIRKTIGEGRYPDIRRLTRAYLEDRPSTNEDFRQLIDRISDQSRPGRTI